MEFLIEKGADIEAMNALNNRPLHYAAKMGNVEVATVLLGNEDDREGICYCRKKIKGYLRYLSHARDFC